MSSNDSSTMTSGLLDELSSRLRFGMKPGLDAMRTAGAALGNPDRRLRGVIHVAGTNGKGAVCAILDECLRCGGYRVGRYTSPHLVRVNERFFLNGEAASDAQLDAAVRHLRTVRLPDLTYFEYLTLVAFTFYARQDPDFVVLETGLGGRMDATNVCQPRLTIITRIGLDHCEWLGDTVEKIAAEKAGIIKPGVPIVLGENLPAVRAVIEARARETGSPFFYAPELAGESAIPSDFSLAGGFNRENAITSLAALKVLGVDLNACIPGFGKVIWPGRFQRLGNYIVDGAHNPPAAKALAKSLAEAGFGAKSLMLICGFCGDKDVDEVLKCLLPFVSRGLAVRTHNPRSLSAEMTAAKLSAVGIPSVACASLPAALELAKSSPTVICGSLFLAGEALVELGAPPWGKRSGFDPSERLRVAPERHL